MENKNKILWEDDFWSVSITDWDTTNYTSITNNKIFWFFYN